MGLGATAKKIQMLSDTAEDLYHKLTEVLERVRGIETSIEETNERVTTIEHRLDQHGALIEAIAEANGVDVEEVLAAVEAPEAEGETEEEAGEEPAETNKVATENKD